MFLPRKDATTRCIFNALKYFKLQRKSLKIILKNKLNTNSK
jgi:hypothetical protein